MIELCLSITSAFVSSPKLQLLLLFNFFEKNFLQKMFKVIQRECSSPFKSTETFPILQQQQQRQKIFHNFFFLKGNWCKKVGGMSSSVTQNQEPFFLFILLIDVTKLWTKNYQFMFLSSLCFVKRCVTKMIQKYKFQSWFLSNLFRILFESIQII